MNIIERFLEFFRKKEYYAIDYENLNIFSVAFKEITDEDLEKIKKIILELKEANSITDNKANLIENEALKISNIDDLVLHIKNTILEDYRKTYFEAIEKKWNFNYFLTDYPHIYKDSLFIYNRLSSQVHINQGDFMYPIIALRKFNGNFYTWSFVEDYEGFI